METLQQYDLVLELALSLKENGSWAGETHVQKAAYFLTSLCAVPIEFDFILYKHGPFSFELREALTDMEALGFIKWNPMPPYGPSIASGELGDLLRSGFDEVAKQYTRQIRFVSKQLGSKNVATLERLATALYVTKEGFSGISRVTRLRELKPHVSVALAEQAIREFDIIESLAASENLICQ